MEEKNNKITYIILTIAALFLIVGVVLLFMGSNSKENNDNNQENIENNNQENTENNNNEIDNPTDDDELAKSLYYKYHSLDNPVGLNGNTIENKIYNSTLFNVSEISEFLPNEYAIKILDVVIYDINNEKIENYEEVIYDRIEQAFKSFFGNKVEYNQELFKCFNFSKNNDVVRYFNNCGDTSDLSANYTFEKVEKNNNNIYIYENVIVYKGVDETDNYKYKWTFELQDDGNYYFLNAERVK